MLHGRMAGQATLFVLLAGSVSAATLHYGHGDSGTGGGFFPTSGGAWNNADPNWLGADRTPVRFAPGDAAIFRHDGGGDVSLTLTEKVSTAHIRAESGRFSIGTAGGGILSSAPGIPRAISADAGASLSYSGLLDGAYQLSAAGELGLTTAGAVLHDITVNAGGRVTLAPLGAGGPISVAGDITNRGTLSIGPGAEVRIGGQAWLGGDSTTELDGSTLRGNVLNHGRIIAAGENRIIPGSGTSGFENYGTIRTTDRPGTITVDGEFASRWNSFLEGSTTAPLTISADRITLHAGTTLSGLLRLEGDLWNRTGLDLVMLDGLHGNLDNAAWTTITANTAFAGNGHDITNAGTFAIGGTGDVSALGLFTNRGSLTVAAGGRLALQEIRHEAGRITSSGRIETDLLHLAAEARLSGEIQGRVEVAGDVVSVDQDLTVENPAGGPTVAVTAGELRLASGLRMVAPAVENAGTLMLSGGSVLVGNVASSGALQGSGLIDGDLRLAGEAVFDRVNITGTLVNDMAAPRLLSGFGAFAASHLENRGTLTIDRDLTPGLTNAASGDLTVQHDVTGPLLSYGRTRIGDGVTLTGGLAVQGGETVTTGTVNADAEGVQVGAAGVLTVAEGMLNAGDLVSDGALRVQDGAGLTADSIALTGGTAEVSGRIDGDLRVGAGAELTLDGAEIDGPLTNAGSVATGAATGRAVRLRAGLTNSGTANLADAEIEGTVANSGTLELAGRVAGTVTNTGTATLNGGFAQIDNSRTLTMTGTADSLGNTGSATLTDAEISGNVTNAASAALTVTGGSIGGSLSNSGEADIAAQIGDSVVNAGTLSLAGRVAETVTNNASGSLTVAGDLTTGHLTNAGRMVVAQDQTLTTSGLLDNRSSGALEVLGRVDGAITNAVGGSLVTGADAHLLSGLENRGNADLQGRIDGGTTNTGGTIRIGDTLITDITNRSGGRIRMGDDSILTGNLINESGATLDAAGRIEGDLQNRGTTRLSGTLKVSGDLANTGTLTQTAAGSVLSVGGTLAQSGNIDSGGFGDLTIDADTVRLEGSGTVGAGVDIRGAIDVAGDITFTNDQMLTEDLTVDPLARVTVTGRVDGQGSAAFVNAGHSTIARGGELTGLTDLSSSGRLEIASGAVVGAGTVTGQDGTIINAGRIEGEVALRSGVVTTSTGVVAGAVENAGRLNIQGRIDGPLANVAGGTLSVTGSLNLGAETLANDGMAEIQTGTLRAGVIRNRADLTLDAGAAVAGSVQNSGRMTAAGRIAGPLTNDGTLRVGGALDGALVNRGTAELSGDLTARSVTSSGTLTFGADRSAHLVGTLALTGGTAQIDGALTVDRGVSNEAGLTVSRAGLLRGDVTNTGRMDLAGTIRGDLSNTGGTVVTAGDATISGTLTNGTVTAARAAPQPQPAARMFALAAPAPTSAEPRSVLEVRGGDTLTVQGGIRNGSGGQITVAGRLAADVTSADQVTLTGRLDGSLTTTGTASLGGMITGDLVYQGGTMQLADRLRVGGTVDLRQNLAIAVDTELTAGQVVNRAGQDLNLAGDVVGELANHGSLDLRATGAVRGDLVNAAEGVLTAATDSAISGRLANRGTVDLTGGGAGTILRVGGLSGDGTYRLDVDLSPDSSDADRIVVRGGAVTGHLSFDLNMLNVPSQSMMDRGILLLEADEAFAAQNSYSYSGENLPLGTEKLVYGLEKTAAGDLFLGYGTNATIGGISANVVLTQSLIGSVINRPTSPFVTGYAVAEGEPRCSPGAWTRATRGRADARGASAARTYSVDSSISASYAGMQFGGDLACFDGYFDGWNMAFGVIGGISDGSTTQPVYLLDWTGSNWEQTDQRASVNTADFRQGYGGIYVTASRENISADLQLRHERTRFTLNNRPLIEGSAGLGLTDSRFGSRAWTLSGSLSYARPLGQGWQIVPTAGFALTHADTDDVHFDDGERLAIRDSRSHVGFLGATLSRGRVLESGVEAVNYYATGTIYKDFASGTKSEFIKYRPDGTVELREDLVSDNLGVYGEIGIGAAYTRILQPGAIGSAKQFSASVRVDGRTGDSLDGVGVTAQMRLQF